MTLKKDIILNAIRQFYASDIACLQALVSPDFTFNLKLIKNLSVKECFDFVVNFSNYAVPHLDKIVEENENQYLVYLNVEIFDRDLSIDKTVPIKVRFDFKDNQISKIEVNYEFRFEYLKFAHKMLSGMYLSRKTPKVLSQLEKIAV